MIDGLYRVKDPAASNEASNLTRPKGRGFGLRSASVGAN